MGKSSVVLGLLGVAGMTLAAVIPNITDKNRYVIAGSGAALNIIAVGMQIAAWNRVEYAGMLGAAEYPDLSKSEHINLLQN